MQTVWALLALFQTRRQAAHAAQQWGNGTPRLSPSVMVSALAQGPAKLGSSHPDALHCAGCAAGRSCKRLRLTDLDDCLALVFGQLGSYRDAFSLASSCTATRAVWLGHARACFRTQEQMDKRFQRLSWGNWLDWAGWGQRSAATLQEYCLLEATVQLADDIVYRVKE